ncbi:MAG TPA: efflux RND transporter periplasmic adaptor subunit, partial [Planctomycetaceae bacterium]|nr:efflux RND transporter periplasmic adaptor subunit [Planctomycetaceae bacterium]
AAPVAAPPAADPTSLTADLYFELGNAKGELRPGQRVFVRLPLQGEDQRLAVPVNAVLYDIHGGTWVYQRRDSLTLRRTRVSVVGTADGFALLASGPAAGTEVVVDGAAEVFGTEFGTGK